MTRHRPSLVAWLLLVGPAAIFAAPTLLWLIEGFSSSRLQLPPGLPIGLLAARTAILSAAVSLCGAALALPIALICRQGPKAERTVLTALVLVPLLVGLLARNYSWIGVLSYVNQWSDIGHWLSDFLLYRRAGIVVVMSFLVAPMSFFILGQTLSNVPSVQIDAAFTLGLNPRRLMSGFYLRVLRRPLMLALLFNFSWSAGFFITPRMIGGGNFDLLGNVVVEYANLGRFDYASTIALVLLAVCVGPILGLVLSATLLRKRELGS